MTGQTKMARFESCGGPAATAMVSLSRLGVPAAFAGAIGDDTFGKMIQKNLLDEKIDISALRITPGRSSQFAFICVSTKEGKRTIFWKPPSAPEPGKLNLDLFPNARYLHVDGLMIQSAIESAKEARRRKMTVVMDAGTLREGTLELISLVDVLIASETFADPLTDRPSPPKKALLKLKSLGPREVVITLGAKGSIGLGPSGSLIRQPAYTVKATDTTGAGDVYHGAYIYGLIRGWAMKDCMAFASAAAALKCKNGSGWVSIPTLSAVQEFMTHRIPEKF